MVSKISLCFMVLGAHGRYKFSMANDPWFLLDTWPSSFGKMSDRHSPPKKQREKHHHHCWQQQQQQEEEGLFVFASCVA